MNFLNAALLPALGLLLVVPLIIHLLNLRFPQIFPFSSIKRLRDTVAQRSRLYRARHRILLCLRTLLLLALLFAFLKPLLPRFGSSAKDKSGRSVLVVIDQSLSMEHRGGGVSARQRAEIEADKILSTLSGADAVNVMLVGETTQTCFVNFSSNLTEARRFVHAIKPGLGRANFSAANATIGRLMGKNTPRAEVYYLTDFQRKNWANVDFTPLPPTARLFFVGAAPDARANRAILGATLNQAQILAGDTVTLEVEVGNFAAEPLRDVLKVVLDASVSFSKDISVAPWSSAKITLPVPPGSPGVHLCEISLPPDELPQDDRFCLTIPVLEKEGVLIVSDAAPAQKDAALFLETALNPYENHAGSLLPERANAAGLTPERIAGVRKIFLTRTGRLSEDSAKLLADFVFHGGNVVWFLDGDAEIDNIAAVERAAGAAMPLKLQRRRAVQNVGLGAQQISRGDFKSKFLRLFRGAGRQDLALLEFYDIYDASSAGNGHLLLNYADETPAMAQLDHGLGTFLFLNFSISEFSSNLARQRIFPAWMQEIVKNLGADEALPTSTAIGETVRDEVWRLELKDNPLRAPSGVPMQVKTEPLGERTAFAFVPDDVGFYTLSAGSRLLHAYGVNTHPDEADLRTIDRALLPERLGGRSGFLVEDQEDFSNLVVGKPIFHWFVLGAAALLAIESLFQAFIKRASA
jgi:hypothetical protein